MSARVFRRVSRSIWTGFPSDLPISISFMVLFLFLLIFEPEDYLLPCCGHFGSNGTTFPPASSLQVQWRDFEYSYSAFSSSSRSMSASFTEFLTILAAFSFQVSGTYPL